MKKNNYQYGISNNNLKLILNILKSNHKVNEVILFGSRAKGNYKEGSDIDIAIKTISPLDFNELNNLKVKLDDLLLPYEIDLIEFSKITNNELLDHISRVGISLT